MIKLKVIVLSTLLLFSLCTAQTISIEWQKSYGGSYVDHGTSIDKTSDGGYILLGQTNSSDRDIVGLHGYNIDLWVVKTNNLGNIQWKKCLGGTGIENAKSIKATSDGGYIIAADTQSNNGDLTGHFGALNTRDAWIIKLDNNGNIEWQKNFGGTSEDIPGTITETSQGFLMVGYSYSNNENIPANKGGTDVFAVLYDKLGNIIWVKNYGGTGYDYATSVVNENDGFIIAGYTSSSNGDLLNAGYHHQPNGVKYYDFWVFKIDLSGNIIWSKCYGGSTDDQARSIAKTSDGGYIVTGNVGGFGGDITNFKGGPEDFWVLKIDNAGNIQWEKSYGGAGGDVAYQIKQTQDNGYIIIGTTNSDNGDIVGYHAGLPNDIWVLKINNNGAIEWQRPLGGSQREWGSDIVEATNGGFIALGSTASQNGDGDVIGNPYITPDLWLIKLNNNVLSNTENNKPIENSISISPNPVKNYFSIRSKTPVEGIKIYSSEGKIASEYTTIPPIITTTHLVSGIYFIHIKTKSETVIRKLIKE